jgi:hypothetical protein
VDGAGAAVDSDSLSVAEPDAGVASGDHEVGLLGGERAHVGGLGTLAALGDIELNGLAFFQPATFLDGADVDEHVVARLGLDEAIAPCWDRTT